jgi:hypothetical protein
MARNSYNTTSCSWYRLDLDVRHALIPGVVDDLDISSIVPVWEFLPRDILRESWLAGLPWPVTRVLVFGRTTDKIDTVAHMDNPRSNPSAEDWSYLPAAINWCVGPDYQPMQWWSAANTPGHTLELETVDQGSYVVWPLTELELIDQCVIGSTATLVRIDQPHSIAAGAGTRISISLRLAPWSVRWPRIVQDFIPWIKV